MVKGGERMELGKQIYELRKKANLSQEQLAEKVGVSRQTISKWELGETAPDIKQAQILSQIFNISLDELTGNDTKEVIYEKVSNTEKLAGLIIKIIKIWGIIILACLIIAVVGIILFGYVREEGSVEFENNVEKVTFTEVVGEETYIITIGSDGYFEGIGMSDEIKEDLMELIVVGDLPKSEDNITDYFIKLREELTQSVP
ncbi:MAG: helix-turn-helix transcriptional regulator [Paludibacteraceae bacterium]|jgi:transcriptional regulator with XRE-family HTH domain|nr:helix-turn-helix transcriptional regulator [Paludibacteraceae bacterium]